MKVMIIGANGQLGTDLQKAFSEEEVIPLTHSEIEITDPFQVKQLGEQHQPDVLINTAAYHDVQQCERNPDKTFLVNAVGVKHLAQACRELSTRFIHISTDYVFDGRKKAAYTEDDVPNPLNTYGVSKLAGEFLAQMAGSYYIIRVASLFGITGCRAKGGRNFVETMLNLAKTKDVVQVTSNITCSPTYTLDAAHRVKEIAKGQPPPGIYHVTNHGVCSWYEFALEIFRQQGINVRVEKKEEKEEVEGILRPLHSALASQKLPPMRHWKEAVSAYLEERSVTKHD